MSPSSSESRRADPDQAVAAGLTTRPRVSSRLLWALTALGVVAAFAWYATHPEPLVGPRTDVSATTRVGVPVYVGLTTPSDRTVAMRSVSADPSAGAALPRVCRGGSFGVTSDPYAFCTSLDEAQGARLAPGDTLVVEVTAESAGTVEVPPVDVSWREGLQWGSQAVGPAVEVTVVD